MDATLRPTEAPSPPGVVKWFKVYCGILSFVYLGVAAASLFFFLTPPGEMEMSEAGARITGVVLLAMGLLLFALCVLPLCVPRRPWVWGYGIGLICLGMTSACFLPMCVPLLIYWVKPETKSYFGKG
jgi:hypothetical protein